MIQLAAGQDLTSLFVNQDEKNEGGRKTRVQKKQHDATAVFLLAQVFDLKNKGMEGGAAP